MANLKTLDSLGGFSVGNTTIVSDTNDAKNLNTLEIKNQFFIKCIAYKYQMFDDAKLLLHAA